MPEDQAEVMEQKLTIKLGTIVVIGITVLSVLDKLF